MLTQSEIERERYESRRKAQIDYNSRMKEVSLKGTRIGAIQAYEVFLDRPVTPYEQLERLSLVELIRLADDLKTLARQQ